MIDLSAVAPANRPDQPRTPQPAERMIVCPFCRTDACRIVSFDAPDNKKARPEPLMLAWNFECLAGHKWRNVIAQAAGKPILNAITNMEYETLDMAALAEQFERAKVRKQLMAPLVIVKQG